MTTPPQPPPVPVFEIPDLSKEDLEARQRVDPLGQVPKEIKLDTEGEMKWQGPSLEGDTVIWQQNYISAVLSVEVNGFEMTFECRKERDEEMDDTDKRIAVRQCVNNVTQAVSAVLGGTPWDYVR